MSKVMIMMITPWPGRRTSLSPAFSAFNLSKSILTLLQAVTPSCERKLYSGNDDQGDSLQNSVFGLLSTGEEKYNKLQYQKSFLLFAIVTLRFYCLPYLRKKLLTEPTNTELSGVSQSSSLKVNPPGSTETCLHPLCRAHLQADLHFKTNLKTKVINPPNAYNSAKLPN